MKIIFAAEVGVDTKGYVIRDVVTPALEGPAKRTLMGETINHGSCICEVSGKTLVRSYTAGEGRSLWKPAAKVANAQDSLRFFRMYGPILPATSVGSDELKFWQVKDVLQAFRDIRAVSERREQALEDAEASNFEDVSAYLLNKQIAKTASVYIDKSGSHGVIRVQMLLTFNLILVDMLSEIGVTRRTIESQRQCEHCGLPFVAGGGRGGAKRLDARYCSPTCAKGASRLRQKIACTAAR